MRQALAVMLMTAAVAALAADEKLTLEQVIARHLASIGKPEALAKAKTRVAEGKSKFEIVNAGGYIEGKVTVVSQAGNSRLVLKYPNPNYTGEDMLADGNKIHVYGQPQRSALGSFIYNQGTALLTEGLFEGTLSTAWPLLDSKRHAAKLTYNGLKMIDGQQLHEVRYEPKKRTDLDIRLYFSKEDFRHVLTIAKLTLSPQLSTGGEVANASQQEIRYRVEERFSNFAQFDGMTFPTTFQIRYDLEGQSQAHQRYTNTFNDVVNNVPLDPKTFEIK
ncbi:MAG: hypothetical protein LAO06_03085 [Acidobacteriia bacterium]|nr:hypothetical protein [Terriglobia bacterium]